MKPEKLYLISPREPSGATWLINCFLELGVKTYRETMGEMWEPSMPEGYTLNPAETRLKKWLPILSSRQTFDFRKNIEIEWTHHWPTVRHQAHRIIYFVRDPRDALLSRYRRESPEMTFGKFLDFPDPYTVRNKIDTWCLFNEVWMRQSNFRFFRFEDYKQDANRTIRDILHFVGIQAEEREIMDALENSTFEQAAIAEKKYREQYPDDTELINRASQVGSWQSSDETANIARIAEGTGGLLAYFGYEQQVKAFKRSYMPHASVLDFYKHLPVASSFWHVESDDRDIGVNRTQVLQFVLSLDEDLLKKSGYSAYETFALLQGLEELMREAEDGGGIRKIQSLVRRITVKPWWRVIRAMEKHDIRLPSSVRGFVWRYRNLFKNVNGWHNA
jgi:Sulfotransferase domain